MLYPDLSGFLAALQTNTTAVCCCCPGNTKHMLLIPPFTLYPAPDTPTRRLLSNIAMHTENTHGWPAWKPNTSIHAEYTDNNTCCTQTENRYKRRCTSKTLAGMRCSVVQAQHSHPLWCCACHADTMRALPLPPAPLPPPRPPECLTGQHPPPAEHPIMCMEQTKQNTHDRDLIPTGCR